MNFICNFIKKWLCKDIDGVYESMEEVSKNGVKTTDILKQIDKTKQTVVIVDDNAAITHLVGDDFPIDLFNVIKITGKTAYNDIYTLLKDKDLEIDYLVTDLVLNSKYFDGQNVVELDGIDILILFTKKTPNLEYVIYTGLTINIINDLVHDFNMKYRKFFHDDIINVTLQKSSKRKNFYTYFTNQ